MNKQSMELKWVYFQMPQSNYTIHLRLNEVCNHIVITDSNIRKT